jgi:hypothetical protein
MAPFQGVVTGSIPVGCIIIYDPCHWLVEINIPERDKKKGGKEERRKGRKEDVKNAQEDHPDGSHQYHRTRDIMSSS